MPAADGVTVWEPLVASVPDQLPDAVQFVAFTDDQVIVVELPAVTEDAASDTVGAPGGISANAVSAWTKPNPELTLYPVDPPIDSALVRKAL